MLKLLGIQIPPSCRSINPILSTLMKKEPDIFGEEVMQGYAGHCGLPFELGCSIYDGHFFYFYCFSCDFQIERISVCYWPVTEPHLYSPEKFPGFIFCTPLGRRDMHVYGFPVFEYPGLIKVSCHFR